MGSPDFMNKFLFKYRIICYDKDYGEKESEKE